MSMRLSDKEPDGKAETQENDECTDQAFVDAPKEQGAGIATEHSSETKSGDAQPGDAGRENEDRYCRRVHHPGEDVLCRSCRPDRQSGGRERCEHEKPDSTAKISAIDCDQELYDAGGPL